MLLAVLFDMDGVLYHSMPIHARCWQQAVQHFGLHMSAEEAYLNEGRTGADTIGIVMQRERGREPTDEECRRIYAYKSDLFRQQPPPPPMPGALQLLQQVKADGLTILLVTGSAQHSLLQRLSHDFPHCFAPHLMVTADDVRHGKPHPEPYLTALAKAGQHLRADHTPLPPTQALVIENAPLGVRAATAARIPTVAVNTGPLPPQLLTHEGARHVYPSMQALAQAWTQLRTQL